jgi:hypothetical protein
MFYSTLSHFRKGPDFWKVSRLCPFALLLRATSRCKMNTEQWWNYTDRGKLKYFEKICPSATLSITNPNIDSSPTRGHAEPISAAQNVLHIRDWQRLTSSLRRDRSDLLTDVSHANFCSTRLWRSFMRYAHNTEVVSPNLSHA